MNVSEIEHFLGLLKDWANVPLKATNQVQKRLGEFTTTDAKYAIQVLSDRPTVPSTLRLKDVEDLLREGSYLALYRDLPVAGTRESVELESKVGRVRAVIDCDGWGQQQIADLLRKVQAGDYDDMLQRHEDVLVFSGTKEFGDDWQACKKAHQERTAHLAGLSPGDDIRGALTALLDSVVAPLPYDPSFRSDGLTTPHNRMKYDNE